MPDPDSDDDFMSDKFLVDAPSAPTQSYSERRKQQSLRSLRAGQAKNLQSLKALEEERRREGLSRSLFEGAGESSARAAGGAGNGSGGSQTGGKNKAMEMMMKMGWTVGEGLGRKRSISPDAEAKRARLRPSEGDDEGAAQAEDDDEDDSRPRGGIGSSRSRAPPSSSLPSGSAGGPGPGRTEPIRISLWAGRRGLAARSPSPPPLRSSGARDPDALDPKKLERLGRQTADFRSRQRDEYREKEVERKEGRARDLLVELDRAAGTKAGFPYLCHEYVWCCTKLIWTVPPAACATGRTARDASAAPAQAHLPGTGHLASAGSWPLSLAFACLARPGRAVRPDFQLRGGTTPQGPDSAGHVVWRGGAGRRGRPGPRGRRCKGGNRGSGVVFRETSQFYRRRRLRGRGLAGPGAGDQEGLGDECESVFCVETGADRSSPRRT